MSDQEKNRSEPVISASGPQALDISALLRGRGEPGDPSGDLFRARCAVSDAEEALRVCLATRFAQLEPCAYAVMLLDGRDKDVAQLYQTLVAARAEHQRCYAAAPGQE